MKKFIFLICCCMVLLPSCNKVKHNENYEFPKTTWNMNVKDVLQAYDADEEDIKYSDEKYTLIIENQEVFGEKGAEITFQFSDLRKTNPTLTQIEVMYPDDANMNKILKNMKSMYGAVSSKVNFFGYYNIIETQFLESSCEETEHLKLWSSTLIKDKIPANELKTYQTLWSKYQKPVADDQKWDYFISEANMIGIAWTDNNEIPMLKEKNADNKNKLYFDIVNLKLYDYFTEELYKQ